MTQMPIENKYLRDTIDYAKVYIDDDEDLPDELFFELINELKVSNLLIPLSEDEEELILEEVDLEGEDASFVPIFTNMEEYISHVGDETDFNPVSLDFAQYVDLVVENELDGLVIDIEGNYLPLEREFLEKIYFEVEETESDEDALTGEELKEIFDSVGNESLLDLLNSPEGASYDEFFAELSNATMLNLVISEDSLDEFAKNGIISSADVGGFELCNILDNGLMFGGLFTDIDAVKCISKDLDVPHYVQITNVKQFIDFILRNDFDGFIINPKSLDYAVFRKDILSQASGIEVVSENPKFKNSIDYAFQI